MVDSKEILRLLDSEAEGFEFPMLDNGYYYHGDQKLTIFRNEEYWAILIEVIAFNNHLYDIQGITTVASVFGNCKGCFNDNSNFNFFAADNGIETFIYDDDIEDPCLNPEAKTIKIREQVIPIIFNRKHYLSKGIMLEYDSKITIWEFMRGLIPEYSYLFWLTREELSKKIPIELPLFMTLHNWHHPDLADTQKPSDTETFRELADVIAFGDKSLYKTKEIHNTHWLNWPEGGAL